MFCEEEKRKLIEFVVSGSVDTSELSERIDKIICCRQFEKISEIPDINNKMIRVLKKAVEEGYTDTEMIMRELFVDCSEANAIGNYLTCVGAIEGA